MAREPELLSRCGGTAAVRLAPSGEELARRVRICRGFGTKLLGLMFRRSISESEGALLAYDRPSIGMTSIHMLFVPFPLAVFWLDAKGTVVDRVKALPWRPYYASKVPACHVLELHPFALNRLQIGNRVEFYEADPRP
jgi:uncharacterized membrane protein (UPF0127 family)